MKSKRNIVPRPIFQILNWSLEKKTLRVTILPLSPLGPQVDSFEQEFTEKVGVAYALAVSSRIGRHAFDPCGDGGGPGDEINECIFIDLHRECKPNCISGSESGFY